MNTYRKTICPTCENEYKVSATSAKAQKGIACEACREASKSSEQKQADISFKASFKAQKAAEKAAEASSLSLWIGTKRTASKVVKALEKAGFKVERHNALSGSVYLSVSGAAENHIADVRISDHKQIEGGGFNIQLQDRSGNTDFDIFPEAGRNADDALKFIKSAS